MVINNNTWFHGCIIKMINRTIPFRLLWLFAFALTAAGQNPTDVHLTFAENMKRLGSLSATPVVYRREALRLVIAEANKVAHELRLPESLPITESNLVASYIAPPKMAAHLGAIGNVTTSNYTFYCSVGNRFSYLARTGLEKDYPRLRRESLVPVSQISTNAAYQLAVQWLQAASMDVAALNRDCNVRILAFMAEGEQGKRFVPVYWVYWSLLGREGNGSVASVELFEPTKTIRQLRVEDPKYILRKPLVFTNLAELLSQTNALPMPNSLPLSK